MFIYFLPKGHSTKASKIPFIDNLKRSACASKRDGLVLPTIRYIEANAKGTSKIKRWFLKNEICANFEHCAGDHHQHDDHHAHPHTGL